MTYTIWKRRDFTLDSHRALNNITYCEVNLLTEDILKTALEKDPSIKDYIVQFEDKNELKKYLYENGVDFACFFAEPAPGRILEATRNISAVFTFSNE